MSNSPYLSQDLKNYLAKHKIEDTLTTVVNDLLNKKLDDPYAYMMIQFGQMASNDIKIVSLKAFQILNNEQLPTIKCSFVVDYKLKQYTIVLDPIFVVAGENLPILYDEIEDQYGGKGMNKAIELINNQIDNLIKNKICSDQANIDESLFTFYSQMEKKALNCVQVISYCIPHILSRIQNIPLFEVLQNITGQNPLKMDDQKKICSPKVIINVLQGGKTVQSKCKASKYMVLVNKYESCQQLFEIVSQIVQNIRKTITSGKKGEADLRYYSDGSFICPVDTIADNLKIVEEAINKTSFKEQVGVGISFNADLLYNQDQKKYELENPKQLLDPDQLVDYYVKLVTDKPIVQYIEDGLNSTDTDLWKKMFDKLTPKNILIGSRKLYNTVENLKKLVDPLPQEKAQGMNPQQIAEYNQSRVHLNCAVLKPYEYPTLSKFLEIAKIITNKKPATAIVIQDNWTECTDTTLIDLAFSLNDSYLSFAPPLKYERMLKFNRIIEIINIMKLQQKQ